MHWAITCPPRNSDFPMALGRRTVFLRYCKTRSCISFSKNKFPWTFRYSDSKLIISSSWSNLNELEMKKRLLPLSNVLVSYVAPNKKCFLSRFFWHFYCCAKGIYYFFCYEGLVTFSNIKKNIMTKIRIINPWPPFSFWLKNDYVANFFFGVQKPVAI